MAINFFPSWYIFELLQEPYKILDGISIENPSSIIPDLKLKINKGPVDPVIIE